MKLSDHHRPSDEEAIAATAAAWLAQNDDGLTPAEAAEFSHWRQADPRHEAAVARLEAAWGALQQLRDFRPEARMHPDRDLLRRAQPVPRVVPFAAVASAALAACITIVAVWWWPAGSSHRVEPAGQRYATTNDGYQRVALEDGSVLELNANTEVSVQFTPAERRVRLERGEAHFTVAKNRTRPFRVEAGTVAVQAIGTAFNVRLGSADVEVLVTEGKVAVGSATEGGGQKTEGGGLRTDDGGLKAEDRGQRSEVGTDDRTSVLFAPSSELVAGQRAVISTRLGFAAPVVEVVAPAVIREELAWQGPRLVFADTPLAEVVARFNRRNQVQLVLGDKELGILPVGGSFRAENVDGFVRLLAMDKDIVVDRRDATHIVLRKMQTPVGASAATKARAFPKTD